MCNRLEQVGWPVAAEYCRLLDDQKASTVAGGDLLRKLKYESGNVYDMLDCYGWADVYRVCSHLSSLSHTSVATANAYLEWTDDATPQIRRGAPGLRQAAVTQLATALLQAAHVMDPLLADNPMRVSIDRGPSQTRRCWLICGPRRLGDAERPHRAPSQAAPLGPLPDGVTSLDHFRLRRHDRASGVIHEYRLVA